jgi:uncharacterized 2Fe-2S/4Fe-4S cluster protein (DUF4445 family)
MALLVKEGKNLTKKIRLQNSPVICNAGDGDTILFACARGGVILSAPCGGRGCCGKCKVQLLEGQVKGVTADTGDENGYVLACSTVPVSDITIAYNGNGEISGGETSAAGNGNCPARAGVAIDIGTTTVSGKLIDLDSSLVLDTVSELNDQRAFGADVMSRIGAARNGRTGELFALINRQTQRILRFFMERRKMTKIERLVVSGNTVMLHLFLNVDPSGMGELPFTPVFLEEKELNGEDLSLPVERINVLPSISAFIGGDITSGLAVLDIMNIPSPSLLVDIGTNGEMALVNRGTIYCCSTAAGPAFEGAEISCGMGGIKGAISAVDAAADAVGEYGVSITTIGNTAPIGICGSGLVDAVALMLKRGIIDETGFMIGSEKKFYLAPGISINGGDIRKFQLAKSAIFTGIRILCRSAGLAAADIKNVFIAGGLGFFINKQNAANAGLFPKEFLGKLSISGNLSLQGAEEGLLNKNFMKKCKDIISRCTVIELAKEPSFTDEFTDNLLFTL